MTTRRDLLRLLGGGIAACACAAAGLPSVAFAAIPGSRRLVVVLQRGAMDGLGAVAPLITRCSVCLLTPSIAAISTIVRRPSAGRMSSAKNTPG